MQRVRVTIETAHGTVGAKIIKITLSDGQILQIIAADNMQHLLLESNNSILYIQPVDANKINLQLL